MGWFAVLAGVIGFAVGFLPKQAPPPEVGIYLSVAVLAGLDAVIGGARAVQEGNFKTNVFLSGFVMTVLIAVGLSIFGDHIGVPIWLATVFVFVSRVLQNVSYIRRYWLEHETLHVPHLPGLNIARKESKASVEPNTSTPDSVAKS